MKSLNTGARLREFVLLVKDELLQCVLRDTMEVAVTLRSTEDEFFDLVSVGSRILLEENIDLMTEGILGRAIHNDSCIPLNFSLLNSHGFV